MRSTCPAWDVVCYACARLVMHVESLVMNVLPLVVNAMPLGHECDVCFGTHVIS